jgi:hypothetical protein
VRADRTDGGQLLPAAEPLLHLEHKPIETGLGKSSSDFIRQL